MRDNNVGGFVKSVKRNKRFDDGYGGRRNNKKQEYHRQARANGQDKKSYE